MNNSRDRLLLPLGLLLLALSTVLHFALSHAGASSDMIDFVLGVAFGVGLGMLLLFVIRARKGDKA